MRKFYLFFYSAVFIVHLFLPLNWGDDAIFFEKSSLLSLKEFLSGSARPIIDAFTYFFTKFPLLRRIINPFILIAESLILSKYLPPKNSYLKTAILSRALLSPSIIVVDAGFIATTLNYLWAVTFGLISLIPAQEQMNNQKISCFEKIILLPCLLYATNMQQTAILLVVILGIVCFYFAFKKRFSVYVFFQFSVSVFGTTVSYILNTVGNNSRLLREADRYFPNFEDLSVFQKIELGFSSTFYSMTMEPSFAWIGFLIFLSVLAFFTYKTQSRIFCKVIVSFPLLFSVFGIIHWLILQHSLSFDGRAIKSLHNYKMTKAVYSFDAGLDLLFIIVFICVIYTLFILIKSKKLIVASLIILFSGLGTRMLMGFSPTVWASGYRTFYIMFLSLIIISYFIISENRKKSLIQKT